MAADTAPEARPDLRVLLSSLALVGGKLATMGLGFLAWMIAARLYPATEVGLASAAVSAVTLCAQLALVGVGSAVITLLPRFADHPAPLLDTAINYLALTAAGVALLFLAFAGGVLQELSVIAADPLYGLLFVVLSLGGTIGVLFDQVSTARRRGDQVLVRGIVAGSTTLALVALVGLGPGAGGSRGIFAAWALGGVVTCALGLVMVSRAVRGFRYRPRLEGWLAGELTRVGLPNYVLTLTERAPGFVLPIVVTEVLSPADNAAWYMAWMMAWVVFVVPIQVGMTSFAEIAREPARTSTIVRHGVVTSLAVGAVGALLLAVLAEPILGLLGSGYVEAAALPLRILVLGFVPMTAIQAYFSVGRARQRLGEPIALGAISCIASIIVPAAAGLAAGLVGMAAAWLAVQVATATVAAWLLGRLVGRA